MKTFRIAFGNVKKSIKDYTIYFFTLTFGVCIFYVFNSFESQRTLMLGSESRLSALTSLDRMMGGISVFISLILGFLIIYANQFLIKRRKKEFGIYTLLGMKQGQISRILMIETMLVGLLALGLGLVLGIFLSQGVALITAKLLHMEIARLVFIFSSAATIKAVAYFGLSFLVVLVFNVWAIRKQRLLDLLYADRKNEPVRPRKTGVSVIEFLCAAGALFIAYFLILSDFNVLNQNSFWICILLGFLGTLLFFHSLSDFFLKLVQKNQRLYFNNLNMFVLRQIKTKMSTACVSISMICLMLFVSIVTLSSGLGISNAVAKEMQKNAPFDASYSVFAESDMPDAGTDFITDLKIRGQNIEDISSDYATVRYYAAPELDLDIGGGTAYFVKLSDYNAALMMQGAEPLALDSGQYAINANLLNTSLRNELADYADGDSNIILNESVLQTNSDLIFDHMLINQTNRTFDIILIVNDDLVNGLSISGDTLLLNYRQQTAEYEARCKEILSGLTNDNKTLTTKIEVQEKNDSDTTILAFMAVYIGIIFLITAAAVLAIAQLSEASDNVRRYGLLGKIGTSNKMISHALFLQILIYFGTPMVLAVIHSIVGIMVCQKIISAFDKGSILTSSFICAGIILLIYGTYFWATYAGSKKILIREQSMARR